MTRIHAALPERRFGYSISRRLSAASMAAVLMAALAPVTSFASPVLWSALGSNGAGDGALSYSVLAMASVGGDLYVGGDFVNAAGIPEADHLARWDGTNWSAVGSNGAGDGALNASVRELLPSGGGLYVAGDFVDTLGDPEADFLAYWDGATWSGLGSNGAGNGAFNSSVVALAEVGGDLFAGGPFSNGGGIDEADYVARWDGSNWSALGSNGAGDGALGDTVEALAVVGSDLFVSGYLSNAAGVAEADFVARWDGVNWSALGSNGAGNGALNSVAYDFATSGTDLYAGGYFFNAGGVPEADYVARWDGSAWSALGSNGAGDGAFDNPWVHALAISGSDVFVGGTFTNVVGSQEADYLAHWDGSGWSAVGSNGAGDGALNNPVWELAAVPGRLYVGGVFTDGAGIAEADYLVAAVLATGEPGDTAPPEITTTISGPQYTNGSDTYVTSDSTLTVNVSDPSGIALCTITISGPGGTTIVPCAEGDTSFSLSGPDGTYTVTVNATDGAGNTATQTETYTLDNTAPTLAPTVSPNPVAQGQSATASPNATDGAGSGVASAGCDPVNTSTVGPQSVTCTATDNLGNTASAQAHYLVYAVAPGGGTFVVGDQSATGQVTFWGAQWAKLNKLSGGPAPSAFKGYAASPSTPSCSGIWTTGPGNSANPPAGPLPSYMAVIVTSSTGKSGSAITGNSVHVVVVKTNPGYSANPGHAGTGTVVATIC